jgi:hypothetical protein
VSSRARWRIATLFVIVVTLVMAGLLAIAYGQRGTLLDQRAELQSLRAEILAREEAEMTASNTQQVVACLRGVTDVPLLLSALDGLDAALQSQVEGARDAIVREPGSPLNPTRQRALKRAMKARAALSRIVIGDEASGGLWGMRRTLPQCQTLARNLEVDITPLLEDDS